MSSRIAPGVACGPAFLLGTVLAVSPLVGQERLEQRAAVSTSHRETIARESRHAVEWHDEAHFTALQNQPAAGQLLPWPELEKRFEVLRRGRKTPEDSLTLHETYNLLASPKSTGSQNYPEHCAKLAEWRKKVPKSTTAMVCLAAAHIQWAWEARGGGWAHTVTEEGWQQFHTRIGEARKLLEEAVKRGVDDGEAHSRLLTVAMAESLPDEQARAWLNAGCKLDPLYVPLYFKMAQGLMPRWGGEPGDVEKFANEIPRAVKGDDGLEIMAWVAYHIHRFEANDPVTLLWGQYDHKLLMQAAEILAKRYSSDQGKVQFAALCSVATQDHAAAKRLRPQVGPFNREDRVWLWQGLHDYYMKWAESDIEPAGETNWAWGTSIWTGDIAFAPNPRFVWSLQGFGARPLVLLDLQTRSLRMELRGPLDERPLSFAFDKGKKWAMTRMNGNGFKGWMLWDIETKVPVARPTEESCLSIAINPARPQVAWVEKDKLYFLDIENGEEGPVIDLQQPCHRILFSADGKLIAATGRINSVWDVTTGEQKAELPYSGMMPRPKVAVLKVLAIDEDGSLWVSADAGSTPFVPGGPPPRSLTSLLRFAPDGKTWTVELETFVREGQKGYTPDAEAISPDRKWVAVTEPSYGEDGRRDLDGPGKIQLWHVPSGKPVKELQLFPQSDGSMVFSNDSKHFAVLPIQGHVIRSWNLEEVLKSETRLASQRDK